MNMFDTNKNKNYQQRQKVPGKKQANKKKKINELKDGTINYQN